MLGLRSLLLVGIKKPAMPVFLQSAHKLLDGLDVFGELALLMHGRIEGDILAFCKGAEAGGRDLGEVSEQIFAAVILCNEAEALCIIEPLD